MKKTSCLLMALLALLGASSLFANPISFARLAVNRNQWYDFTNITYFSHSADTISFRDSEGGTIIAVVPAAQMPTLVNTVLAYRAQPANLRIQLTEPYNSRTRGCTGSYMSLTYPRQTASTTQTSATQSGTTTVSGVSDIRSNGNFFIQNLTFVRYASGRFHFRDAANLPAEFDASGNVNTDLQNQVNRSPAVRLNITARTNRPYNPSNPNLSYWGTVVSFTVSPASASQTTQTTQTAQTTQPQLVRINEVSRTGEFNVSTLTYVSVSGTAFTFRDPSGNTAIIQVATDQNQERLMTFIDSVPSRTIGLRVQVTSAYNASSRTIRGNYISHGRW